MERRWVVVGASGMLGREVVDVLRAEGEQVRALSRADLDVTDAEAVGDACRDADVVVNCSAWTAVDDAETYEAAAFAVNAVGPALLGRAAAAVGARLLHVSTDYVFAGDATAPYAEHDPVGPRSAYGRTKLSGEWAVLAASRGHLVLRTAWLYGDGACFPRTMARLLTDRDTVSVVDDQIGQPTWTRDVARLVLDLVAADVPGGVQHATSSGSGSWYDLAREVALSIGADPGRVLPTTSDAYHRPAPRPSWSVLGHDGLRAVGVEPVADWRRRWAVAAPRVLV